jgi:hypothetical protein
MIVRRVNDRLEVTRFVKIKNIFRTYPETRCSEYLDTDDMFRRSRSVFVNLDSLILLRYKAMGIYVICPEPGGCVRACDCK